MQMYDYKTPDAFKKLHIKVSERCMVLDKSTNVYKIHFILGPRVWNECHYFLHTRRRSNDTNCNFCISLKEP